MALKHHESYSLTTFRNKGRIPAVLRIQKLEVLRTFLKERKPYFILGKGSNCLIQPHEELPCLIQLSDVMTPFTTHGTYIQVGAGTSINKFLKLCQKKGLLGLEFAAGVPATLGGMVTMNFGCWGKEIADFVKRVHVMCPDGHLEWISGSELGFAYRHSKIQNSGLIVLEVVLELVEASPEESLQKRQEAIDLRIKKQPLRAQTFGSIFKNPKGEFAGQIIEALGFKGYAFGGVQISKQHANFMENRGGGTYVEAITVIQEIQKSAKEKGFNLEVEVQLLSGSV